MTQSTSPLLRRLQRGLATLAVSMSMALHAAEASADVCIPNAIGVPGQNGPPDFLGTSPQPYLDYYQTDPRWQGSAAVGHSGSAGGSPHFRALRYTDSATSQRYLYLSWAVYVAPAALGSDSDYVQLGIYEPGTAAGYTEAGWAFRVRIPKTTEQLTATPVVAGDIEQLYRAAGTTTWGAIVPGALPWLTTNAVWWSDCGTMVPCTDPRWMLNVRVPIVAPAGFDPSDPSTGLALSDNFRLWYDSQVQASGLIQAHHAWPDGMDGPGPSDWATFALDPTAWTAVQTGSATPCTGGVTISASDISTSNSPTHHILTSGPNEFNVAPHNASGSPIPHDAVSGRIRIADWGSAGVGSSPDWTEICATTTSSLAGDIASPGQFSTQCEWTVPDPCVYWNGTDPNPHGCAAPGPKYKHQCVLVELTKSAGAGAGTDIFFSRSSAWRNMDVVQASRFERNARISVRGLAPLDPAVPRDVYLYVQTRNLPKELPPEDDADKRPTKDRSALGSEAARDGDKSNDDKPDGDKNDGDKPDGDENNDDKPDGDKPDGDKPDGDENNDEESNDDKPAGPRLPKKRGGIHPRVKKALAAGTANLDEVAQVAPTYMVHVFHDTGKTTNIDGTSYAVVAAQPSFGYFVDHAGDLTGWKHELTGAGAVEIAPNLYKIAVPNDGVAEVRTVIESLGDEPEDPTDPTDPDPTDPSGPTHPLWDWWWLIVLLGLALAVWILRKRNP